MAYLRNGWYVAGFSGEVPATQPLARTLLDEPLVFFRDTAGAVHALHDRCPHRFAPLSIGEMHGDSLECKYHGLRFDGQGQCSFNPHGDGSIPKAARVRAYPVQERHGLVWFWPGDAALADPALIPDYSFAVNSHPDGSTPGYLFTHCHYQLVIDNILDLTHADFLHAGSLGAGALTRTKPVVEDVNARTVKISWLSSGDLAPKAFDMNLRVQGQPTDQWTEVTWTAPSTMLLHVGATLQGEPREQGMDTHNLHLVTPESGNRCHYWYWGTRNVGLDPQTNAFVAKLVRNAFENEDKPVLEAQQQRIGEQPFWSLSPVLLPSDAGAVRARRKLDALIQAEAG